MNDILHDFPIQASAQEVFQAVSTPEGLDAWWTLRSSGEPVLSADYSLYFGPEYDWQAVVTRCTSDVEFELQLTQSMPDWQGTRVGFLLQEEGGITQVRFHHLGWPAASDHFRTSSFCWAMYLRLLKRYVECGEIVPYDRRLDV
jgi:uncharacterized protein YndB with AHSA1/START domain